MNNRNFIKGKKILAFIEFFFGYENAIVDKMRSMGAVVDLYNERSITDSFDKALLKVFPSIFNKKSQMYYEDIISKIEGKDYDYILFLQCDMVPENILEKIRSAYPKAKMCLYLWDSLKNLSNVKQKFRYFDKCCSFDYDDCKKYCCLNFRPLFYSDEFQNSEEAKQCVYDISFWGTIHSDRYEIIRKVTRIIKAQRLNAYWFLYLQSHFIYYYYKFVKPEFWNTSSSSFSYKKMSAVEIVSIINSSKTILDIQHPKQSGLTMRPIEMIGMRKKVITTNKSIKEYDFYNPNNIYIIDRKNPCIDPEFFRTPYVLLPDEIYEKYGIRRWILDVLG